MMDINCVMNTTGQGGKGKPFMRHKINGMWSYGLFCKWLYYSPNHLYSIGTLHCLVAKAYVGESGEMLAIDALTSVGVLSRNVLPLLILLCQVAELASNLMGTERSWSIEDIMER